MKLLEKSTGEALGVSKSTGEVLWWDSGVSMGPQLVHMRELLQINNYYKPPQSLWRPVP